MIPAIEKIKHDLEWLTPVLGMPLAHIVLEREMAIELVEWMELFPLEARQLIERSMDTG